MTPRENKPSGNPLIPRRERMSVGPEYKEDDFMSSIADLKEERDKAVSKVEKYEKYLKQKRDERAHNKLDIVYIQLKKLLEGNDAHENNPRFNDKETKETY